MKRILFFLMSLAFVLGPVLRADPPEDENDRDADLHYLHPELMSDVRFRDFDDGHQVGNWREQVMEGRDVVIVQRSGPIDQAPLIAVEVRPLQTAPFPHLRVFTSHEVSQEFEKAKGLLQEGLGFDGGDEEVSHLEPVVTFEPAPALSWRRVVSTRPAPAATASCTPAGDGLATNDLHHPRSRAVRLEAIAQTMSASDVHEAAAMLCQYVRNQIKYSSYDLAGFYIDSDEIVLRRGEGECDEKAVLLVSYLRALFIPARIKGVRWIRNGKRESHACVEYAVNGVAYHLDPTRGVVRRPSTYRTESVDGFVPTDVLVMDLDCPDDSMSTQSINGIPDTDSHDGRLNPKLDLCYMPPNRKGEPRADYSN
jgi:transglutaminase-like putative cysteine protease